ncbi:MAG: hypothetical protein IKV97_03155 [Clostridia bacterium]|nr:hypothetical protein [Clostridia bacterium]
MSNTTNANRCTLWQLPIIGSFKSMSYCIKTADDQHFVIDGGDAPEAEYLTSFINENFDGRVDAWFITHPHKSHVGAFIKVLSEGNVSVRKIVYSYLDPEVIAKHDPRGVSDVEAFNNAIKLSKLPSVRVRNGDRLKIGKSIVKIIGAVGLDSSRNYINNTGVIYKFNFKTSSVLFLGDAGQEAGLSLLTTFKDELKSDILQMSHHGFYGVSKELYATIAPSVCLWPTRKEIWPATTSVVTSEAEDVKNTYEYMCSIGVEEHYVSGIDGLSEIAL